MCTAVAWGPFFGRTLDVEYSFGETITVTPRRFPLSFRSAGSLPEHYAMVGMALVQDGYPLYFDAVNEKGLCMAALNFPESCRYFPPQPGKENIPSHAVISWVLARCASAAQALPLLKNLNITNEAFSPKLPPSPLHWFLADETQAVTVESCADGLHIHENPVGVLANEPPLPQQLKQLRQHSPGSRGLGLPGDGTSPARFRRAVYAKQTAGDRSVTGFFHMMETVALPKGFAVVNGRDHYTVYTGCCDRRTCTYYYTTYENRQITAVKPDSSHWDSAVLTRFSPICREQIRYL